MRMKSLLVHAAALCTILATAALGCGERSPAPDTGLGGAEPDAGPPADDGGPSGIYSDDIQIIVEPSDSGAALVAAIQGAKTSVHMTMYLLSSKDVLNALIARHNAGVDVRIVLNQSFPAGSGDNATVFSQLTAAGIPTKWAPAQFTYTHEKCVVIDGTTAWIMTMNAAASSPTSNREFLAVDTDPGDVQEADAIFEGDFAGTPPASATGKLLVSPINMRAGLLSLVGSATKTIDLESEELSDTQLVGALITRHGAGVGVRVVIAKRTLTSAQQSAVTLLKQSGIPVISTATPYIHAKTIVVDGATDTPTAYVGSANFTSVSIDQNRELGLVTSAASEIAKVSTAFSTDYANGTAL